MDNQEEKPLMEDENTAEIRAELSQMSFKDLQKLKERLGTKVFNNTMFGTYRKERTEFKRENKNRPREVSSKIFVPKVREVIPTKKKIIRDPRFDSLCGTFNEEIFKKSYSFLNDVKENDLKKLKNELKLTKDPKEMKKIKYLIQRLENQLREEKRRQTKKEKEVEEKKQIKETLKSGEKPSFKKKSEKKVLNLVSQYEELRNSGKLKKHIQRLRKKNKSKDRIKLQATKLGDEIN